MHPKSGEGLIDEAKKQIQEVTPEQVREMQARKEKAVYLDVREPAEWNLGRLPGAVHLPRGNLETKVEGLVDRKDKVVVYCARGNRSARYQRASSISSSGVSVLKLPSCMAGGGPMP